MALAGMLHAGCAASPAQNPPNPTKPISVQVLAAPHEPRADKQLPLEDALSRFPPEVRGLFSAVVTTKNSWMLLNRKAAGRTPLDRGIFELWLGILPLSQVNLLGGMHHFGALLADRAGKHTLGPWVLVTRDEGDQAFTAAVTLVGGTTRLLETMTARRCGRPAIVNSGGAIVVVDDAHLVFATGDEARLCAALEVRPQSIAQPPRMPATDSSLLAFAATEGDERAEQGAEHTLHAQTIIRRKDNKVTLQVNLVARPGEAQRLHEQLVKRIAFATKKLDSLPRNPQGVDAANAHQEAALSIMSQARITNGADGSTVTLTIR